MNLTGRTVAVVGGDEREREIARLAALTGARVRAFGFPWPANGIAGVERVAFAGAALDQADYALFPIPGLSDDGALFAPEASAPILPDAELLAAMSPCGAIILGRADDRLEAAAQAHGITLYEYEDDVELMLRRGPAIIEGALQLAIANTEVTLHSSDIGVVGHGTIGRMLTRTLVVLGARVHLFARSPAQRADAFVAGASEYPLTELPSVAPRLQMLFSTVPAQVVPASVLAEMSPPALVMDLAAPPGGVDLTAAQELGHRAVWARGMGRRAPVTVGRSQWNGIAKRIRQIEERSCDEG